MASYIIDGTDLTDVADAIRVRGNTSQLLGFPDDFIDSIKNIPYDLQPTGTISITENGVTDVTNYANANVNVPGIVPTGTVTIEENGLFNISQYAQAEVDVPGIVPEGTITITQNGLVNVSLYQQANVNVPGIVPSGTKQITITQNGTTTENVTNYVNAEITVNAHVGDYSQYAYMDVQTSDRTLLTATNPLNVTPSLVTIIALSTPDTNRFYRGIFTPYYGIAYKNADMGSQIYCWYPVEEITNNPRIFVLDSSFISIKSSTITASSNSNNWDTNVIYRVKFYA